MSGRWWTIKCWKKERKKRTSSASVSVAVAAVVEEPSSVGRKHSKSTWKTTIKAVAVHCVACSSFLAALMAQTLRSVNPRQCHRHCHCAQPPISISSNNNNKKEKSVTKHNRFSLLFFFSFHFIFPSQSSRSWSTAPDRDSTRSAQLANWIFRPEPSARFLF